MDTDLFQILTLFLLLGLLLTLFGVFLSLGAIRKLLEGGARTAAPEAAAEPVASVSEAPATETAADEADRPLTWTPTDDEPARSDAARSGWPAPQEATVAAEPEPSYEAPVQAAEPAPAVEEQPAASERDSGARVLYGDAGPATATPSESALRTPEPAAAEPEPTAAEPEPEPAATSQEAGTTSSQASEDPQEQPFERDGRWWFRRGDELLVYEEQTGQWVAAGEPSTSGSVAASAPGAGTPAGSGGAGSAGGGAAEGQVTVQQEAVGSFWKCPSCGAVNGSTATSCRMCFTARP